MLLSGRTAFVTGSSRNLGAVIAERLAADGARVAVTYRQSEDEARVEVADPGQKDTSSWPVLNPAAGHPARSHGDIGPVQLLK